MKQIFSILVLLLLVHTSFSQLESYVILSPKDRSSVDLNLFVTKSIGKKWNINCFALMETTPASPTQATTVWAEVMPGLDFSPTKKWNLGLEFGLETNGKPRVGTWIYYGGKKDQTSLSLEKGHGNENYWYSYEYAHTFAQVFDLGVMVRRYTVAGPKIGFTIHGKKENALFKPNFFVVAGVDPEAHDVKKAIVGITIPIQ